VVTPSPGGEKSNRPAFATTGAQWSSKAGTSLVMPGLSRLFLMVDPLAAFLGVEAVTTIRRFRSDRSADISDEQVQMESSATKRVQR